MSSANDRLRAVQEMSRVPGWRNKTAGQGGFSSKLVREFPDEDCTKDITVSTDKRAGAYFVLHQRNGDDHGMIGVDVEAVIEALRLAGQLPVDGGAR